MTRTSFETSTNYLKQCSLLITKELLLLVCSLAVDGEFSEMEMKVEYLFSFYL